MRRTSKQIKGIISGWLRTESMPFHQTQRTLHRTLDLNTTELEVREIDYASFYIVLRNEPAGPRHFLVKVSEVI